MSTIIGPLHHEQPFSISFDRLSGTTQVRRWAGAHHAVLAEAAIQSNWADNLQFDSTGASASLAARFGGAQDGSTEILTTQFEMRGEEITQSIWKHPGLSGISRATQKKVRDMVESTDDYATCSAAITTTASTNSDSVFAALSAFDLLMEGTDSYLVAQSYVFIRTRTGSRNYQAVLEFTYDGYIWSSAQVATYVGDPAPFNVPSLPAVANSERLLLAYGWRKRPTDVIRISNGNQQITESWQSARWTTLLYSGF
jgi:hypothetical protein